MTYGLRYCACGKKFRQANTSMTKCPECREAEETQEAIKVSKGAMETMYCNHCDKERLHKLVGPYSNKYYWKCQCGRWHLADLKGWIV
jgi:hypothetical protein